jgi:hypothetical protein
VRSPHNRVRRDVAGGSASAWRCLSGQSSRLRDRGKSTAVAEHVVGDDKDVVGHGDPGSFRSTMLTDASEFQLREHLPEQEGMVGGKVAAQRLRQWLTFGDKACPSPALPDVPDRFPRLPARPTWRGPRRPAHRDHVRQLDVGCLQQLVRSEEPPLLR